MRLAIAAALIGVAAASAALTVALAQQPASQPAQTIRLRGVIEKLDGRAVLAKSTKGEELKLCWAPVGHDRPPKFGGNKHNEDRFFVLKKK